MQVFNKKYWPYQFRMLPPPEPWEYVHQLERFCYDHFASGNWRNNGLLFAFKRESDATFFKLKWS